MLQIGIAALLVLLLPIGALGAAPKPKFGGIYRYPLRFSPKTLDPARLTDIYTATIVQQLFDGLVDFDRDLNPIPAIARSWRVSRDGRVYTFDLRTDVRFHSGRHVTADDVVYSLTRVLRPETQSPGASQFEVIAGGRALRQGQAGTLVGARVLGRNQVQITLEEPYSPFLSLLATSNAKIVPREVVENREASFERAPIGTGPFRFVRWEEGKHILLEANHDYFRGRPYLDALQYAILPAASDPSGYLQFRNGDFEEAPIPSDRREEVLTDKAIHVIRRPILGILFYGLNLRRPEWRDVRVRRAVLVSLDRDGILSKALRGPHRPTAGLLPQGLPGSMPGRSVPPADPAEAMALLKEAGGVEGLPPIEIWAGGATKLTRAEFEGISESWGPLGLKVRTRYADDWPQFERFLAEGRISVFRYAWYADLPDPDNILGVLFHSKSKYNYTHYANAEVDRLLEQGRTELDAIRRAEIYQQAEHLILADVPVIPFLQLWFEQAYHPYVQGAEVSPLGAPYVPMRKVWLERPGPKERAR